MIFKVKCIEFVLRWDKSFDLLHFWVGWYLTVRQTISLEHSPNYQWENDIYDHFSEPRANIHSSKGNLYLQCLFDLLASSVYIII